MHVCAEMQLFTKEQLTKLSINVFTSMGCDALDAEMAADVLVTADIRGIDSHGVSRLSGYVSL